MPNQTATTLYSLTPLIRQGSPFPAPALPERMVWTSSSLKLFKACKRKWFWKYVYRLRPKAYSPHLTIGKAFHAALGEWYTYRRRPMAAIAQQHADVLRQHATTYMTWYEEEEFATLMSLIETFVGMLMGYAEMYVTDRTLWSIKAVEHQFLVDCGDFDFAGKCDLITSTPSGLALVEHKTAKKIGDTYIERLPLDTQIRGYVFGAQRGLGFPITSVLYDVVRKSNLKKKSGEPRPDFDTRVAQDYFTRPDWNFYREPLEFPRDTIDAFEHELYQAHSEYLSITNAWYDPRFFKNRKVIAPDLVLLPPDDPRAWMPNDNSCYQYFRNCEYLQLCLKGVDRATALHFEPGESLNQELDEE